MSCKYPIVLVHGIAMKEFKSVKAFGRIEKMLREDGQRVYVAPTDGFGTVENNAAQLKTFVDRVLEETETRKVNIIAHSKGGLDAKYMIMNLDMEHKVSSLTTLCTPHKGTVLASKIWDFPLWMKKIAAFWIDAVYRFVLGDENPNSLKTCEELRSVDESVETLQFSFNVYCQSYSTTIDKLHDCYVMALPMKIYKHFEENDNDGIISEKSMRFENYKGSCLDIPVSHSQIVDFMAKKSQKEKIYAFYRQICHELEEMGY